MYFEDYEVGQEFDFGELVLTKEDIVGFAEKYDPRPFHVDEEGGKESAFGDIIASGFQTILIPYSRWVKEQIDWEGLVAGMGIESCSWLKPIYAGDKIISKAKIIDKVDTGHPKHSIMKYQLITENDQGQITMEIIIKALVKKKSAEK